MSVEQELFKELSGLDLEVYKGFVRVGKFKDEQGEGDLYFNIKTLTFSKEKDYQYLVLVDDWKQQILLKYLVKPEYKR